MRTAPARFTLNMSMFELARDFRRAGMAAYSELQEREIEAAREDGFRAIRHQRFVGAGYIDDIARVIAGGKSPAAVAKRSAEESQFGTQKAEGPVEEMRPPMAKAAQV